METGGTRGHTQTHSTALCSHGSWVPQPRVPSPVWPLPKAGQPGPMSRLIQPANPPEAHVLGTRGQSRARMWHLGVEMGTQGSGCSTGSCLAPTKLGVLRSVQCGAQLGFGVLKTAGCCCVSVSPRCAHVTLGRGVPISLFPQSAHVPLSPRVPVSTHGDVEDVIFVSPCLFLCLSLSW